MTNTGQTTLGNVGLTDITDGNLASAFTISDPSSLAAGRTFTYTAPDTSVTAPAATNYGITNVTTATGTAQGGSKVSASSSAHVEVVGSGNPTTIDSGGPAAGANLFTTYRAAAKLEFMFEPGTTVATQSQGSGTTTSTASLGLPSSPSFILISNNASDSPGAGTNYFEGLAAAGDNIHADATATMSGVPNGGSFSTIANTDLYATSSPARQRSWRAAQRCGRSNTIRAGCMGCR